MKALATLVAAANIALTSMVVLAACGCDNRVAVRDYGDVVEIIYIPNKQTVDSIDYNIGPSNSYVTVKWKSKPRETR